MRLVVRRTRLTERAQRALWPDWRHHAFVTDLELPLVEVDQFHREHATVELAIRDLKEGAGLEHCPSGHFFANAAWLACAVLAHNLIRWSATSRRRPSRRSAHRGAHSADPGARPTRTPRQSKRHHRLASPRTLALGHHLHRALDRIRALPLVT